jgi:hypothetical protein
LKFALEVACCSPRPVNSIVIRLLESMNDDPYTREEILAAGNLPPDRGLLCHRCEATVPQFKDLSDRDESRIRQAIRENRRMMAIAELRAATGCSLTWAKIWVYHDGRPKALEDETTPCPYCGLGLRTSLAKRCRHCLRDWHDANNVLIIGDG